MKCVRFIYGRGVFDIADVFQIIHLMDAETVGDFLGSIYIIYMIKPKNYNITTDSFRNVFKHNKREPDGHISLDARGVLGGF